MRGAWEIARLFSRSVFVYLWCLTAWRAERRGGLERRLFCLGARLPCLSLSVITSAFGKAGQAETRLPVRR